MLKHRKMLSDEQNLHDFAVALSAACVVKGIRSLNDEQISTAANVYAQVIGYFDRNDDNEP